jgi:pimeloyl-ACP methyl ester carboxylesterase
MSKPATQASAMDLPGRQIVFDGPAGKLTAVVAGDGPPLLLLHSINAAASVAEIAPLHRYFCATRTVVSLDLPGYGNSARPDIRYTPRLMTDAIHAALAMIADRFTRAPVDAMALSLSCEFLARAACENPQRMRSLAFVSPTGFNGTRPRRGADESTLYLPWVYRLLRGPGWGKALFGLLTRPSVIRDFLRKTFGSQTIDEELWRDAVANSQKPGAEFAPLCFLSGALFSADIHRVYERVGLPVWMSHGTRGDFTDYRAKTLVENRNNWRISEFASGAMPYFELPELFCAQYTQFLDTPTAWKPVSPMVDR